MRTFHLFLCIICIQALCILPPQNTFAQNTYTTSINYTGNVENFTCIQSGLCGGNDFSSTSFTNPNNSPWTDVKEFVDPIPGGLGCKITNVEITISIAACTKNIFGINGNYSQQYYVFEINGEIVDAFNPDELPCTCLVGSDCQQLTITRAYPEGLMNYNYGGINAIDLNIAALSDQHVCITDLSIALTVEDTPPPILKLGPDCTISCDDVEDWNENSGSALQVVGNNGVTQPENAIGRPDGIAAKLWDEEDDFILELEETVSAGGIVSVFWKSRNYLNITPGPKKDLEKPSFDHEGNQSFHNTYLGSSQMNIEVSSDGQTFKQIGTFKTLQKKYFVSAEFRTTQDVSHIRISKGRKSLDFEVDAITYFFRTGPLFNGSAVIVTSNKGVVNPENSLGPADQISSTLEADNNAYTLGFDHSISEDAHLSILWKATHHIASEEFLSTMLVEVSEDGENFTLAGRFLTTEHRKFLEAIVPLPHEVSEVRILPGIGSASFEVDALMFEYCGSTTACCPGDETIRELENLDILPGCNATERVMRERVNSLINFYEAGDLLFIENPNGTAQIKGRMSLLGPGGPGGWDITLNLSGKNSTATPQFNGACSGNITSDWYYYSNLSGSFIGWGAYTEALIQVTHDPSSPFQFQIGTGANLKNPLTIGASDDLHYTPISNPATGFPNFTGAITTDAEFNFNLSSPVECDISLTFQDNITGECPQVIERIWTADDGCNQTSGVQTITIVDDVPPIITCPEGLIVDCGDGLPNPDTDDIIGTDNCGDFTIEFVADVSNNEDCPETIHRIYLATDECGNTSTCVQDIVVFDDPLANAGPDYAICSNEMINLFGSVSGCATTISWTTPGDGQFGNPSEAITSYTPGPNDFANGSVTLSLFASNSNGCQSSDDITITINPAMFVDLGPDIILCDGESVLLTANITGGSPPFQYEWNTGEMTSSILVSPSSTTVYDVVVFDEAGCKDKDLITVSVVPIPTVSATGGIITCENPTVQLTGSSSVPGGTFTWTGPNGFSSTMQNPVVSVPGTYILTVILSETCSDSAIAIVEEDLEMPDVEATGGAITCANPAVQLIGNSTYFGVTYNWSGPGGFTSNMQNPVIGIPGNYILTVTNPDNGCTAMDTAIVGIDIEEPGALAEGDTITCANPGAQLAGSSPTNGVTYSWTGPNGFNANLADPIVSEPGTYILMVTNPENGCTSMASAVVTENTQEPGVSAEGDTITCLEPIVQIIGSSPTQNVIFSWTGPNNFTSNLANPMVSIPGVYILTVTDPDNGCMSMTSVFVEDDATAPGVTAIGDTINCANPFGTVSAASPTPGVEYQWSGPGGFNSNLQSPEVSSPGNYTVTVTDLQNGCISTATTQVEVIGEEIIFDLALRKKVVTPGPYSLGDTIEYLIEIINQGCLDATNIEITECIPDGLILLDTDWVQNGDIATKIQSGPIKAYGEIDSIMVMYRIDPDFSGSEIVSFSEISGADNALGMPDTDSSPDQDCANDAGGQPDSPADDYVDGDGTGTPGDGVPETDEDDQDPAVISLVQNFDLALRKTLLSTGPFQPGGNVSFQIEIINQGDIDATGVEITDYIPAGLILNDAAWNQSANLATRSIPGTITANGGTSVISITFQIDPLFQGTSIVNYAEINSAGNVLNLPDSDSSPDQDNTNDAGGQPNSSADDHVDGDGTGTPGDGIAATDEDDHDPALIAVEQIFDLALGKTVLSPGPFSPGGSVSFEIEITNQGTVDATNVEVTEYIPAGLNLNDAAWSQSGALATRTIAGPIAANGGSATTTITFQIDPNFQGTSIVNFAEISSAVNALNLPDVDSAPDQDNTNDAGGQANSPADDFINGDGTGIPGDGVAATDEDDHDPALITVEQIFDLALRKTVLSPGPFSPGGSVTFELEVINQGSVDASNVEVTDYIPAGLNLNDAAWNQSGALATRTIAGPIAANGGSNTITITFLIDPGFQGATLVNYAEISSVVNALNLADVDSAPDQDNTNDAGGQPNSSADDYIDGNGTGTPGDGVAATDEDDHDPALITLGQVFDLALRKTILSTGPFTQGSSVTFQIEVINQGTLEASNIEVTDYIPTGFNLTDATWTQSGNLATKTIAGPISPNGGSEILTIMFQIDPNFQGNAIVNYSEISSADNSLNLADVDSSPDQDNTNDAGGQANSPADDFINGDGTGIPGDGVAATDEDDHDPALIAVEQIFDLALRKTVLSPGPFPPGGSVSFEIEITNQGTVDATNVEVTEYIPAGLNLNDAAWNQSGALATRTIAGPIAANGGSATTTITFQIDPNFQGTSIVNFAEISSAVNALNLPDVDSSPDQDNTNDAGGQANSPADDFINGDGTGIPGDGVAATDEDDHDPALITVEQIFDLALRKTVLSPGPFFPGGSVTFELEVINQGSVDASNVEVTDYIPAGLNLNDAAWNQSGPLATRTIAGPIAANGGSNTITITFLIDPGFQGATLVNYAEISSAVNALNLPDIDSAPDQDNTNDAGGQPNSSADDYIDGNGTGAPGDGVAATDEDDHDPALITLGQVFDLALRKTILSTGPFTQGSSVSFQIEVINQGTLEATNIEVTDYIPTGFNLTDATWTQSGNLATITIAGPIAPNGGSEILTIMFQIDPNFQGNAIVNYSEISNADNTLNLPDVDSSPDQDNTNDADGQANSPADDHVDGDGTGTPGDGVAATDEDDHDPALIAVEQIFDLALRKTVLSSGPFSPGGSVSFEIEITNQGTVDATNVEVTEYIPAGLNLNDAAWNQSGALATRTIAGPIAANGGSATTTITFQIDPDFQGASIVNFAEISSAVNALNLPDVDSSPDQDNTNDAGGQANSPADDFINGDGTGIPGDGVAATDEDDHDPALITIEQVFDLALRKTVLSPGPFSPEGSVTFEIEVINQGTLDATNVEITDYIPTGLGLNDAAWTQAGNLATRTIAGPVAANGGSATMTIAFQIDLAFQGTTITNFAEISSAANALNLSDIDSDPDQDNTNDAGGLANSPADDYIDGDGTGIPGDGVSATDEDDHDPAQISLGQTFDLALRKTTSSSGPYTLGSSVTYQIEVVNQGGIDATNVEITDYIAPGLTLNDPAWQQTGNNATITLPGPVLPGNSLIVSIAFTINANAPCCGEIINFAEISGFNNGLNLPDSDSSPDQDNTNDAGGMANSPADDYIDGDGTGIPGDGIAASDEDDHDPAAISTEDTTPPALTCPADADLGSNPQILPAPSVVAALDNCQGLIIANVSVIQDDTIGCDGILVFRYEATDSCGNISTCIQTITYLVDNEGPEITCPEDENLGCEDDLCLDFDALTPGDFITQLTAGSITVDVSAFANGGLPAMARIFNSSAPTGGDIDLGTPNILYGGPGINSDEPNGFEPTNNRTLGNLMIIDDDNIGEPNDNANGDSLVFEFSEPVIIRCLTLVDIENPTQNGQILAYDSSGVLIGDVLAIPNLGDNSSEELCINKVGVKKLVVAFDGSGAVNDLCFYSLEQSSVSAFDDCTQLAANVTFTESVMIDAVNGCVVFTVNRSWAASDTLGNTSTCTQTLSLFSDQQAPDISCPPLNLECGDPLPPVNTASVTVSDNCSDPADITVAFVEDIVIGSCPAGQTIRRIYSATDTCGNTALCAQIITFEPVSMPPQVNCQPGGELGCNPVLPQLSNPTTSGGCGGDITVTSEVLLSDTAGCAGILIYRYTATDTCGNTAQCSQIYTYTVDNEGPAFICPGDMSLECGATIPPPVFPTVTDNCSGIAFSTFIESATSGSQCPEISLITRTWLATDSCGNTASCVQTISVIDSIGPIFLNCPENATLGCGEVLCLEFDALTAGDFVTQLSAGNITVDISAFANGGVPAMARIFSSAMPTGGDFDLGTPNILYGGPGINSESPGDGFEATNNSALNNLMIIDEGNPEPDDNADGDSLVFDFSEPVIIRCLTLVDIENPTQNGQILAYNSSGALIGDVLAIPNLGDNSVEELCIDKFGVKRLVVAFDGSGAVDDLCFFAPNKPVVEAHDACTQLPADVTCSETGTVDDLGGCVLFTVSRQWTATDACGNVSTCEQVLTLFNDQQEPELSCAPLQLNCGDTLPPVNTSGISVFDNCSDPGDITVAFVEDIITGTCPETQVVRRIYSATDTCDNIGLCAQIITFSPPPGPSSQGAISMSATILLGGPLNQTADQMESNIPIPVNQPYNVAPFNYMGNETCNNSSLDVIDWVLLELREEGNPSSIIAQKSGLLMSNGAVVSTDEASPVEFDAPFGNYHLAIRHRNHLSVMTAEVIDLSQVSTFDFSTAPMSEIYLGSNSIIEINGKNVLIPGNVNGDEIVNNTDLTVLAPVASSGMIEVYDNKDVNLDGMINNTDLFLLAPHASSAYLEGLPE